MLSPFENQFFISVDHLWRLFPLVSANWPCFSILFYNYIFLWSKTVFSLISCKKCKKNKWNNPFAGFPCIPNGDCNTAFLPPGGAAQRYEEAVFWGLFSYTAGFPCGLGFRPSQEYQGTFSCELNTPSPLHFYRTAVNLLHTPPLLSFPWEFIVDFCAKVYHACYIGLIFCLNPLTFSCWSFSSPMICTITQ